MAKPTTSKTSSSVRPTTQANDLCRASYPDGGVAFQKYNPRTNKWGWVYVGAAYLGKKFTRADVLYQLRPSRCFGGEVYAPGWYRYVLVRWLRRKPGWRAQVLRASPAVYWSAADAKAARHALKAARERLS